jgi:hypothetical protein
MKLWRCRTGWLLVAGFILVFATACSSLGAGSLSTPLPDAYLPTAIAQTLQAEGVSLPTDTLALQESGVGGSEPESEATPEPSPTWTEGPPPIPLQITLPPPPSPTPPPEIPEAAIQIYRLGDRSKVVSPIQLTGYIRRGYVGPVRVELLGEDGRVLYREIKSFDANSELWANLSFKIEFEISAAAELGRLTVRTIDVYGRPLALNSVDLILMSGGEADTNPATALYDAIVIQDI